MGTARVVLDPATVIATEPAWPMGIVTGCVAGPVMVTDTLLSVTVAVLVLA